MGVSLGDYTSPGIFSPLANAAGSFWNAVCVGVVFFIACVVSHVEGDKNRGAIVFLALVIPALFGTAAGFTIPRPEVPPDRGSSDGGPV